jgi:hypothetical protein
VDRKDALQQKEPTGLVRLPRRVIEQYRGMVATMFLLFAVLFLFGIMRELQWRLDLRNKGYKATGIITAYDGPHPVVEFVTYMKQKYETPSPDQFTPWTRPPIGSKVEVFYDPGDPSFIHVGVSKGLARFEWLSLPAVLAFLFLNMLRLGLTMLLFFGPNPGTVKRS